jgi:small conductance mechanosensitive channel
MQDSALEKFWDKISDELIFLGIVFVIVFVLHKLIDFFFNRILIRMYHRSGSKSRAGTKKRYKTLGIAFSRIASFVLWTLATLMILADYGVNVEALLAGAGAAGIVFGIAGKDIIMDFYVGINALIEDQYRIGDVIWIDQDHAGTVEDITLRVVKLRDIDGNVHVIPHSLARSIINKTYDYSTVNIEVSVVYTSDIDKVTSIVNAVGLELCEDKDWTAKIIEPINYQTMLRYDKQELVLRAQGKVKPGEQWGVASEYKIRLKRAFDKSGIEIPFGQNVMRTISDKKK